jgi:thioesterase domain-containing protein/acyl carrier protein
VLGRHGEVEQCAVVAREKENGDKRLVAYVVGKAGRKVEAMQIQAYLHGRMPNYMVPSAIMTLEKLPLTANGKLDRKALLTVELYRPEERGGILHPRDNTELYIRNIWEEVLGIQDIAISDNFFDIGGHSLTAVALAARIETAYNSKVSVKTIFDNPTIEELAQFVRRKITFSPPSSVIPIHPRGTLRPFFCVHPAGGLVNCYMPLARHLRPDVSFYGLQSYGLDEGQSPLTKIEEMAAQYIKDLKRIQPLGPYQIGGWSLGGTVAYEMAQQLCDAGEEVSLLALFDADVNVNPILQPITDEELVEAETGHVVKLLFKENATLDEVEALEFEQQVALFLHKYKESGKMPADVTLQQCRRFLRVWAINERAKKRYLYRPFAGRVTLFRSSFNQAGDETYGWHKLARGGLQVFPLAADHDDFVDGPNAKPLAERLRLCMDEVYSAHVNLHSVA